MTDGNPGPGDQHDAKGAPVQVLTAEVRTHVAGSPQVTMSVYNRPGHDRRADRHPALDAHPGQRQMRTAAGSFQ